MSRDELRYELAQLRLQLGGLIVGVNAGALITMLTVMALAS